MITSDEVRTEISEAMDAVAAYSEKQSDQALTEAREALNRLDAEIERRERTLRENWAAMSDTSHEAVHARLRVLRQARNRLGEGCGALESVASRAWDEMTSGFSGAWNAFFEAWTAADGDAANT